LYKPYFAVRYSGPVDKRTVKYGIGYLVCAGFKPAMIDLRNDDTTVNGIPLIIHQTWKTNEVPEKWKEPQESWTNQSVIYPLKRKKKNALKNYLIIKLQNLKSYNNAMFY
jgi:hypothetical protein